MRIKFRMNIQSALLFCFLTGASCDGIDTSRCIQGTEGGSVRVECPSHFPIFGRKFFCKEFCKGDNILVETFGFEAQNGRYRLERGDDNSQRLFVSVTQLMKSDSGRYRCEVRRAPLLTTSYEFHVCVTEASTTLPEMTPTGLLLVCVVPVVVAVLMVVLLLRYKKRIKHYSTNKKGNMASIRTQTVLYENRPPLSTHAESIYQSLDPATRTQDQIYFTLT